MNKKSKGNYKESFKMTSIIQKNIVRALIFLFIAGISTPMCLSQDTQESSQETTATSVVSDTTKVLSLSDAVYTALEYNRELQARAYDKEAASEAIREAQSAWWPQIGWSSSWDRSYSDRFKSFVLPGQSSASDQLGFTGDNFNNKFQVTQLLYDRTVIGNIKLSELQEEAANWQEKGQQQEVVLSTVNTYLSVLAASELLEVQEQRLVLAQEQLDTAQMNYEVGLRILTDVLRAKLTRSSAQRDVNTAQIFLHNNQVALNQVLGVPIETKYEYIGGTLSKFNPPKDIITQIGDRIQLYNIANDYHPSIQVATVLVSQSEESIKIARGEFYPRLSAGGSWGYSDSGGLNFDNEEWGVKAQVDIPIFEGFRKTSKIKRTKAQLSAEQQRYEDTVRLIRTLIEQTVNDIEEAKRNLEIATEAEQVATENHRRFLNLYQEGLAQSLDVTTALTELVSAQSDVIQSRYGYLQIFTQLLSALGIISTNEEAYDDLTWLTTMYYKNQAQVTGDTQ
jgi:outer membrane protein